MRFFSPRWLPLLALGALAGCTVLSGAEAIIIDKSFDDDDDDGTGGIGAGLGPGAIGGTGGSTVTPDWRPVDGVTIDAVAFYQGVKRALMVGHAPVGSGVPIVESREALVRISYTTHPDYNAQPVTARLEVGAYAPFELTQTLAGVSGDGALDSTINFNVPAEAIIGGAGFRIDLLQPPELASGNNTAASYPADGHAPVSAQSSGPQLRVTLIPIRYDADGSGRLPDTSDGQLQRYRNLLHGIYPAAAIELNVGTVVGWSNPVDPYGDGWSELLNAMLNHRQSQGAPPDEYYYGLFSPASSMASYCSGGCVAGLSTLPGPNDPELRAGIGLGFSGDPAVETAVHEIGHLHGLPHAPCTDFGTIDNVDPNYPHAGAVIGEWGYDLVNGSLKGPTQYVDMMSYCEPIWISDYNYQNLFNRIRQVNGAARLYFPETAASPSEYERISVGPDGTVTWLEPLRRQGLLGGEPTVVTVSVGGEQREIRGAWYPYSHVPGGLLLFPQPEQLPTLATWRLHGQLRTASRSQLTSHALTHKRR